MKSRPSLVDRRNFLKAAIYSGYAGPLAGGEFAEMNTSGFEPEDNPDDANKVKL